MKKAKTVLSIIAITLIGIILFVNVYFIIAQKVTGNEHVSLFGYSGAVVMTDSMVPEFSGGDMIIVKGAEGYSVNDVIMFDTGLSTTTHRIIEITESGFITQGDNNNAPDIEPVPRDKVIGKVVSVIPNAGNIIFFFQSPAGMLILLLVLFAVIFLPSFFKKDSQ